MDGPARHLGIVTPACARGGSEEYVIAVAREALTHYQKVTVCLPDVEGVQSVRGELHTLGVRLRTTAPPTGDGFSDVRHAHAVADTAAILGEEMFDRLILVLPSIDIGGPLIDAAALVGPPTVVIYQLAGYDHNFTPLEKQIYTSARRQRQAWLAVSDDNRRRVCANLGWDTTAVDVRPNALLTALQPPSSETVAACRQSVREELGLSADARICLTVARLDPQKGLDTVVGAAALVAHADTSTHFVWIGDGVLRADADALVRAHELEGRVHLLGRRHDVPRFLAAADAFVLASRFEGRPFAVLEAMASGLPCILSDIGPHRELIQNGVDGRLVPVDDEAAFASALKGLLDDPAAGFELGREARARAAAFSPTIYFDRLFTLVERVGEPPLIRWPSWPEPAGVARPRIAIYGTGAGGRFAFDELEAGAEIVAFVDSRPPGQGRTCHGRPVIAPEELLNLEFDTVVLASCWYGAMQDRLAAAGVPAEQIEIFPQWRLTLPRRSEGERTRAA